MIYENDKGLNAFLFGCSDKELIIFLKNLDKYPLNKQKIVIDKMDYSNRLRIVELTE